MAIYAVFGTDAPEEIAHRVRELFDEYLELAGGQWFIQSTLTTKEVAEKIMDFQEYIPSEPNSPQDGEGAELEIFQTPKYQFIRNNFIVVPVTNYWGIQSAHIWEWLSLKKDDSKK
ncbi:hypothetical protein [Aliidiomarina maris]|uniref:Uncharacterized protein n=1 Tax=Aliidiomarina maris TaxID=531312 RepID=A0A327X4G0_9GAMM|nr:hypothetical protein [Aliidiomarina maris]RAK01631.1 hypothetical protein B0I24_101254 [Aliidiomarina maris]RUO28456.1 hypothetical protein CWE07_01215 [Aliidiomarina maris]